jgi:hypothetical protein
MLHHQFVGGVLRHWPLWARCLAARFSFDSLAVDSYCREPLRRLERSQVDAEQGQSNTDMEQQTLAKTLTNAHIAFLFFSPYPFYPPSSIHTRRLEKSEKHVRLLPTLISLSKQPTHRHSVVVTQ